MEVQNRAQSPMNKKRNKKKKRAQSLSDGALSDKSDVEMLSKKSEDMNSQDWVSDEAKVDPDFDVDAIIKQLLSV